MTLTLPTLLVSLALTAAPAALVAATNTLVVNTGSNISCTTAKGESGFNIQSFSLNGTDPATAASGSAGSGAGKPTLSDLTVSKQFDSCSEPLIKAFLVGTHLPTVTLTDLHTTEGHLVPILTITLKSVIINSYNLSGSTSVNPVESIGFSYGEICIASTTLNADGSTGATTTVCYNVAANKLD